MSNKLSPLVSVLMPAYNSDKYISEAIESVLNQTYKNFECIIVDDDSPDKTWDTIKNYAKKDKRIRIYKNKKNTYIALNRNKCIGYAKGKYVVWQDADDISLPQRIEKLVNHMEKHPKVGICGSYLQSFDDSGNLDIRKYATDDKTLRKDIFKFSPVAQPSAIIRRKCFDEFGLYNNLHPPAEDIDMSFRIGTKYEFSNIPQVFLRYREHPNSATGKRVKKILRSTLEIRKKYSKGHGYKMTISDRLAYCTTWIMQFVPYRITIILFKLLRNITKTLNI